VHDGPKTGTLPVRAWLPDARAEAPTPMSLRPSGTFGATTEPVMLLGVFSLAIVTKADPR